jgi:hypothetical protein
MSSQSTTGMTCTCCNHNKDCQLPVLSTGQVASIVCVTTHVMHQRMVCSHVVSLGAPRCHDVSPQVREPCLQSLAHLHCICITGWKMQQRNNTCMPAVPMKSRTLVALPTRKTSFAALASVNDRGRWLTFLMKSMSRLAHTPVSKALYCAMHGGTCT